MEDYGVWAGFTATQRKLLRKHQPELVGELTMLVKTLVNLSDDAGNRIRRGDTVDLSERLASMYVKRGFAEQVGSTVLDKMDDAVAQLAPKRARKPVLEPMETAEPEPVVDPEPVAIDEEEVVETIDTTEEDEM